MTIFKKNLMSNCCLQTQTVYFIKLKMVMLMNSVLNIKKCLILVDIPKIVFILMTVIKKKVRKDLLD